MNFSIKGFLYQGLIDPILSQLHEDVTANIDPSSRVIDIACGTGSLSMAIAAKASYVSGIDLSEEIISVANRSASKKRIQNVSFEYRDASDLSVYNNHEFDVAVTSMAIHQFDANLAIKILTEMKRIAKKLVIVDYNYPMPEGFSRSSAYGIEWLAGGDHHKNFRVYMKKGGIHFFTDSAGLTIQSEVVKGNGVFVVVNCT